MKINNKKGFTLIELIITIAILATIISISYILVNKLQVFSQGQKQINNIQLGINNLRKYITEDFKQSTDFISPSVNEMKSNYSYKLSKNNKEIEYKVEYTNKGSKGLYSIKRIEESQELSFIEKQPLKMKSSNEFEVPLLIAYSDINKIYSVQINYGKSETELYTFDVYNGDVQVVGSTDIPDIPNVGSGGNLIKQYLIQVNMLIQQIKYEARGESFDKEIDVCIANSKYIIDNFDILWKDRNLLKLKIHELMDSIQGVHDKVDTGDSQHKKDIRYYIRLSNSYIEKSIYILDNQNYYDQRPELTVNLIKDFTLHSGVVSNYYVCLKNIKNYSLENTIRNGTLEKLKAYLNTDGDSKVSNLQIRISEIQGEIDIINNNYLQPMYHPLNNINDKTIQELYGSIKELIKELENYKDVEIKELLLKDKGEYKYFDKPYNQQDLLCTETLIDNINQNINIIIEEIKYIMYSMGVDID